MREIGLYDDSNNIHTEALKFCFYGLIQNDLDNTVSYWNHHKIRPTKGADAPHGRPDLMYYLPWKYGGSDKKCQFDLTDVNLTESMYAVRSNRFCCSDDIEQLASMLMTEHHLLWPRNRQQAEDLYLELVNIMTNL